MVELDVHEVVLHRALRHVLDAVEEPAGPLRVSDQPDRACDVLVTRVTPGPCRDAVRAVRNGTARAILCADAPDDLPWLLAQLRTPWCAIPRRVLESASLGGTITSRQAAVVEALVAGRSLLDQARAMGISEATLKRDLRRLRADLGVPDRPALVALVRELGL